MAQTLTGRILSDDFARPLPGLPGSRRTWTRAQLDAAGLVPNLNMWIGAGWIYCGYCRRYQTHYAMSHAGTSDCFEVCVGCDTYTGWRAPERANALGGSAHCETRTDERGSSSLTSTRSACRSG
jgi:hypothetical protein